jgi:chemotaxis protein methyltransferase CheR
MELLRVASITVLTEHFEENDDYLDLFLKFLSVDETELFRDPSLWCKLRDFAIPSLLHSFGKVQAWFPDATSGDELFSFLILWKENFSEQPLSVSCTHMSRQVIETIKRGVFPQKKADIGAYNYTHFNPERALQVYYRIFEKKIQLNTELLKPVTFQQHALFRDRPLREMNLVVFRNKMLYFSRSLQEEALELLAGSITDNGFLVLGFKERTEHLRNSRLFVRALSSEQIYRKNGNAT